MKDIVFDICQRMLANSPERSYKRLNSALRSTLANCIEADLPFQPSTFQRIYNELRGGRWFGDGSGSHIGEGLYTGACEMNHASAQQSFEKFAERPACLWEENAKTSERLHVGSQFTWQGHYVTVTSMRKESLVACTYKDYAPQIEGIKLGATVCYDPYYIVTATKRDGASTWIEVEKAPKSQGDRVVARRFTIPYSEITEFRRTAKARVKAIVEKISKCNPETDREKLTVEVNEQKFRHFELEEIQKAFQARKDWIENQDVIEQWRKGDQGRWLDVKGIYLRVNGDLVECSNGNSVSKPAAARALPILLANRNKTVNIGLPLGGHTIDRVSPAGVKIGCTLVPWSEIDVIAPALKS